MTRRRRAAVLLGLSLVLGTLASTHMARREAALRETLGPVVEVVVARRDLPAGARLELSDLAVRSLPARYAPPGEPAFAAALAGHKLAVPVPSGGALSAGGNVREWVLRTFAAPDDVEARVARMAPDSHGLTVLPFLITAMGKALAE